MTELLWLFHLCKFTKYTLSTRNIRNINNIFNTSLHSLFLCHFLFPCDHWLSYAFSYNYKVINKYNFLWFSINHFFSRYTYFEKFMRCMNDERNQITFEFCSYHQQHMVKVNFLITFLLDFVLFVLHSLSTFINK